MSVDFDPYRNWLGIPANEARPINYYRLCGVELFEADTDIISLNADKQMDYVRRFSHGPQGEIAEGLLTEISKAKLTLLKPDRKYDYDLQLRRSTAQNATSSPYGTQPALSQPQYTQPAVMQPYVAPAIPQPLAPQPMGMQPVMLHPNTAWQVPPPLPGAEPIPAPAAYPAPAPQYGQPQQYNYNAPGTAYPNPGMQQVPYQAPVPSAPATYSVPAPPEEAPPAEEPANPFNPFGNAPNPARAAVDTITKPARKSSANLWVVFGGLVGACIALAIVLNARFAGNNNQTTSPQAKKTPKAVDSQPKELAKEEEQTSSPTSPSMPTKAALRDIPNGIEKKFEYKITMQGDSKKYLRWSQNVEVHQETEKLKAAYWRPVDLNKEGSLVYYFPVDFYIRQGTLQASLRTNMVSSNSPNFDKRAYVYLEVSPDGKQWHRVDGIEPGSFDSAKKPLDIGKYLLDAKGVYVKASLFSSKLGENGKSTAQFLRAYPDTRTPVFTLTLRGLQPGPEIVSNSEPSNPILKSASIPKVQPVPVYEEVVVEPPPVPTAADLMIKSENEAVLLALQEWRTGREALVSLKARNDEQYLRRFDEEIKQYESSTVMKPELVQEYVECLNQDKENFLKSHLFSLSHAMLPHNQIVSSYIKEQAKIERLYETLIDRLKGEKLEESTRAYEALKYHDELLQPLVLCALSFKKTSSSTPEILCLCSNSTINLEPNSKWRIDRKMQLIFNRGEDTTKEYSFAIGPSGRTMKETSAVSIASLQTHFGALPVLKRPQLKTRVLKRPTVGS